MKAIIGAVLFFSTAGSLFAQRQPAFAATETKNRIKFVRAENDMLIFDVQLGSLPAKPIMLSILDEDGNNIFEEWIFSANHYCRYKIVRNDMTQVTFKVSGGAFSLNQSFNIHYRIEEKLEVIAVR